MVLKVFTLPINLYINCVVTPVKVDCATQSPFSLSLMSETTYIFAQVFDPIHLDARGD